ncbi:RNA helicase required for poly(A+) mRNA export, partial [Arachnomyces sp. PD_36]
MSAENTSGSLEGRISKPEDATSAPKPAENEKPADDKSSVAAGQNDGASESLGGSNLHEPEYEVDVKLSDLQADPNNPLYSAKTFEQLGLTEEILKGLQAMNYHRPSKIQERALPLLLSDPPQNMIGQSQSGTGKTAAFVLNILRRVELTEGMRDSPQALVLAPSRELARQIVGVIQVMASFVSDLKVATAVPMESNRGQRLEASVVVGTPGTVMDMIKKRLFNPSKLKVLVLDEADNMLDQQGLGDQCIRVKALLPKTIQLVLFSATFSDHVVTYANKFAPNSNQLTLKHEELTVEGIKQLYLDCDNDDHKYDILVKLYGLLTIGSSIIFVKSRQSAAEIERRMVAEGHRVASLTGGIEGQQRDTIIDAFRSGEAKVLITTNVLARGIDVRTVSMVVNY